MKKRIIAISFIVLFVTAVVWMVIEGSRPEVLPLGSKLPEIEYTGIRGTAILQPESTHETLIIYFSEKCSHCKYELNMINTDIEKLENVKLYFISIEKDIFTDNFVKNFKSLSNAKNVTFGIVNKEEYENKYGSLATPTLYFFNGKGILTSKIKGETKFERIIEELKKSDSPEYRNSNSK